MEDILWISIRDGRGQEIIDPGSIVLGSMTGCIPQPRLDPLQIIIQGTLMLRKGHIWRNPE